MEDSIEPLFNYVPPWILFSLSNYFFPFCLCLILVLDFLIFIFIKRYWKPSRESFVVSVVGWLFYLSIGINAVIVVLVSFLNNKTQWFACYLLAALTVGIATITREYALSFLSNEEKKNELYIKTLKEHIKIKSQLLTVFRMSVVKKLDGFLKINDARNNGSGLNYLKSSLSPREHCDFLLTSLGDFLSKMDTSGGELINFRMGIYALEKDYLVPLHSKNLNNPRQKVFTSYQIHKPAFHLDDEKGKPKSLGIKCLRERNLIIVTSCHESEKTGDFTFFCADQKSYLKSIVAFYMDEIVNKDGDRVEGVLIIDTNREGFFKEDDRKMLASCFLEFSARLKLELVLRSAMRMNKKPKEEGGQNES